MKKPLVVVKSSQIVKGKDREQVKVKPKARRLVFEDDSGDVI